MSARGDLKMGRPFIEFEKICFCKKAVAIDQFNLFRWVDSEDFEMMKFGLFKRYCLSCLKRGV